MLPVRVPAGAGQAKLVPEYAHKFRAGFHQATRRQRRLPEDRHAIRFAQRQRFARQVERGMDALGADERISHLAVAIQILLRRLILLAPRLVELLQQ